MIHDINSYLACDPPDSPSLQLAILELVAVIEVDAKGLFEG
jgi:hypothetical protein